jgi:hypothetical protein
MHKRGEEGGRVDILVGRGQEVTKRCRLSWLTNSALVYESKCGGTGGSCGGLSQRVQLFIGAQINLEI